MDQLSTVKQLSNKYYDSITVWLIVSHIQMITEYSKPLTPPPPPPHPTLNISQICIFRRAVGLHPPPPPPEIL